MITEKTYIQVAVSKGIAYLPRYSVSRIYQFVLEDQPELCLIMQASFVLLIFPFCLLLLIVSILRVSLTVLESSRKISPQSSDSVARRPSIFSTSIYLSPHDFSSLKRFPSR